MRSTGRATVDEAGLQAWLTPWDGVVRERPDRHDGTEDGLVFVAEAGPFRTYRRTVTVEPADEDRYTVTSTVQFRLAIPYFGWLLAWPVVIALRAPGAPLPRWGPADRIDARAATAIGTLCMVAVVAGYLGTAMTQTLTYAARDFGIEGNRPQTAALSVVRVAVFLTMALVAVADRRGRRQLILVAAVAGCLFAATTALAPSLAWYTTSQVLTRGCATALALLITVVAAEEMPAGARAFGVSVLGMSAALGAGLCVIALPLTDIDEGGWRLLFLVPLLALPLLKDISRRLPESRRFTAAHAAARIAGHAQRLVLLATSAFLLNLFTAPATQLQNEFLRDNRGYSAIAISLFTICTGTPAGIGIVVAGRLADVHGRRLVGAVGLLGGVGGTVAMYLSHGPSMWLWSLGASVVGGATLPALGVYGPELFPTGVRARANGALVAAGVAGSVIGLQVAGSLSDRFGELGPALALLAIGPAILVILVLTRYPETAHRELEELNPEDRPAPPSAL